MRAVTISRRGRWIWAASGVVTAAVLAVPGVWLLSRIAAPVPAFATPQSSVIQTVTVPQVVTSMTVDSDGAPVFVHAGNVRRVQVIETLMYDSPGAPPAVTPIVVGGHLTLTAPECGQGAAPGGVSATASSAVPGACAVSFDVTAPPGVSATVSSGGGPISVSGIAGASLDSGDGMVSASSVDGPLTISSDSGPVRVNGVTGTLNADSGGGFVTAQDVTATSASVTTEGGPALIAFAAAPDTVTIRSDGGMTRLTLPGGPYALNADSGGAMEQIGVPVSATAKHSITISTSGAPLVVSQG
jgi:hypothetical protein